MTYFAAVGTVLVFVILGVLFMLLPDLIGWMVAKVARLFGYKSWSLQTNVTFSVWALYLIVAVFVLMPLALMG